MKRLLLALGLGVCLAGCSEDLGRLPVGPQPEPTDFGEQQPTLEKSAFTTDALMQWARQVLVIPFPGGSVTLGYRNGFYSVRVVMFGSDRTLQLQFQDGAGRPMDFYDPFRTRAIRILTLSEDVTGLRQFDVLIRGVELASDEFRVQGNGRYQFRDTVWYYFANNLVFAKVGNPYPLRGTLVMETPHESGERTSVTYRFNGSRIADGTLVSGSVSVFFTLDLVSLDLQPREPTP